VLVFIINLFLLFPRQTQWQIKIDRERKRIGKESCDNIINLDFHQWVKKEARRMEPTDFNFNLLKFPRKTLGWGYVWFPATLCPWSRWWQKKHRAILSSTI
jgi:hypothetical protein